MSAASPLTPEGVPAASGAPLGIPGPVLHGLLLLLAACAFGWILSRRLAVLKRGTADPRFDRLGERLRRLFVIGFCQSRQPRYLVAGVVHILIFFGFLILLFRSLTLLGLGFHGGFVLPGFDGNAVNFVIGS